MVMEDRMQEMMQSGELQRELSAVLEREMKKEIVEKVQKEMIRQLASKKAIQQVVSTNMSSIAAEAARNTAQAAQDASRSKNLRKQKQQAGRGDEMGIGPANELVIRRALKALEPQIDYILIDAFTIDNLPAPSQSIIRGDASVYCIAAASICAKVHRDALMKKYAEEFPEYGFDGHVGYGTAVHRKAIETHGLTVIHRRSFQPMAGMI